MDGDRLFYTLLGGIGLVTVCGIALKVAPGTTPAVAAVAAPPADGRTAKELFGEVFPSDFPVPVARELLSYVRVSPNPAHLSVLESMRTLYSWKDYSPLQVCRAKRDGMAHMITEWQKFDPKERAGMVTSIATADDGALDCVAILTQNPQ